MGNDRAGGVARQSVAAHPEGPRSGRAWSASNFQFSSTPELGVGLGSYKQGPTGTSPRFVPQPATGGLADRPAS